jgi:CBS domain containing-hemolysin-like protein
VCQLGITVVSLGLGWIGERAFAPLIATVLGALGVSSPLAIRSTSVTSAFILVTLLHIILGELVPKSAAIRRPARLAVLLAAPLRFAYLISYPALYVMNGLAMLVLRSLGIRDTEIGMRPSEEELRLVLAESSRDGVLSPAEEEIMQRATRFSDRKAWDVMVSRSQTAVWDPTLSLEANLKHARQKGHTRFPVVDPSGQRFLGVINVKDLAWCSASERNRLEINRFLRPILPVSPNDRIDTVIRDMRQRRIHIASVEEKGKAIGILTMEDIIEEIFGEIEDEFDPAPAPA